MKLLRLLLFPFSLVYALVVMLRNIAFNAGIFSSKKFEIPVICIGNLTVGGAGKTPMAEYIIRLLKDEFKIAALSRGYGRKTTGFLYVGENSSTGEVGDEPLQFKTKFPEITVAVCEKRVVGIELLEPKHDIILLDDAYQHRAVKPGFSILLFDYSRLFNFQWFLPTGNLREPLSGRRRADVIVVTKTPSVLSLAEKERIIKRIKPFKGQGVFFSYLKYGELVSAEGKCIRSVSSLNVRTHVLLLTGIANSYPLVQEIKRYTSLITHHEYGDHHPFTRKNILKLATAFEELPETDKIIITTEKDMQRLRSAAGYELLNLSLVYYLPVESAIHEPSAQFNSIIRTYVNKHLHHNRVH